MTTKPSLVLCGILLSCTMGVSYLRAGDTTADPMNKTNIQEAIGFIAQELARCPCWLDLRPDEIEFRSGVTRLYVRLASYDTEILREAINSYVAEFEITSPESFHARAKVFAFLRVVFAVPEGFTADAKFFGNWGNPVSSGRVNLLWPYSKHPNGGIELTGANAGEYSGPPYDPIAEFDELWGRFGRRMWKP